VKIARAMIQTWICRVCEAQPQQSSYERIHD